MKKLNKIVFFIGPSSSGKDTFFSRCLEKYQVNPIILLTSRPMREGEKDGREYHFINQEKMDLLDAKNKLIERRDYQTKYGVWSYATGMNQIDLNEYSYLTPNTWEGYCKFLKIYSKESLIPIYFELDEGVRLQRALGRERKLKNPKYDEMCRRFLADNNDFRKEYLDFYKPFIIDNNGTMEETEEQLEDIFVHKLEISKKLGM